MKYKNITVAGTGVLGSQIAYQTAYKGFHVNVYDVSEEVLRHAGERLAVGCCCCLSCSLELSFCL